MECARLCWMTCPLCGAAGICRKLWYLQQNRREEQGNKVWDWRDIDGERERERK